MGEKIPQLCCDFFYYFEVSLSVMPIGNIDRGLEIWFSVIGGKNFNHQTCKYGCCGHVAHMTRHKSLKHGARQKAKQNIRKELYT